jgi:digeranylgeranylglycerophospholipid reductase
MDIIGGGPVGLWAAKKAADAGIKAVVHEYHTAIGEPEHCTGLLSRNIDRILQPEVVLHYVNGARFFAKKQEVLIERKKVARVIDRAEFDKQVYEEAMSSGARVRLGERVHWKDFRGDVAAADGVTGITRTDFGQRLGFLPAMQFDLKETPEDDFVELWFEPWNPDFFVWVVPRGNQVRVGTAARDLRPLQSFIGKRFGRFRPAAKHVGLVVTSGPVKRTAFREGSRQVFLVGDAAGQVKPTTGGGIYTGMSCAESLVKALAEGKNYEKLWRSKLGRELALQKMARGMMLRNPPAFLRFLRRSKFRLESQGDMDHQSRVILRLVFPGLLWLLESLKPERF